MVTYFNIFQLEANCENALLYIDNSINYIARDDLCIYKSKGLKFVFIEIINSKGKKIPLLDVFTNNHASIQQNLLTCTSQNYSKRFQKRTKQ